MIERISDIKAQSVKERIGEIDGYGCDTGCSVWECVC